MQISTQNLPPYLTQKDFWNPKRLLEVLPDHPEDAVRLHSLIMVSSFPGVDNSQCIMSADYLISHTKDRELLTNAYHLKGCVLLHYKKYDEAIPMLKKAVELDPEAETTLYALAECYTAKRQYDDVLECYHSIEEVFLKDEDEDFREDRGLYNDIGETYFLKLDYKNAEKYFQKSFDVKPSVTSINGLGRVAATTGDNDKALEYFTKALELKTDDAYIYYYIGQTWQNKNDFYRAMQYYTEALKLKPDFAEVYNNIGALYVMEEGDLKSGINNMLKALEASEKDGSLLTTIYLNLAKLYNKIADYDQAEYYNAKLLKSLGFPTEFGDDEDEDGMDKTE